MNGKFNDKKSQRDRYTGYFTVPLAYKSTYYDTEIMYCDPIIINFILQNVRSDVTIFLKGKILTCKR